MAILLALDPDYPVPRGDTQASARPAPLLLPKALLPRGACDVEGLEFSYEWSGPQLEWELVVLDDRLDHVLSVPCSDRRVVPAPAALQQRLSAGGVFYWFVRGAVDGLPIRCSPVLFQPNR